MRSELIICKNPGLVVADDYTQEALKTHPTALGFAVDKNGVIETHMWDFEDTDLLDAFLKTQETYKDQRVFFHLMRVDEKEMETLSPVSMQPFKILLKKNKKDEEECILAVMLDGDFLTYIEEKDETPAYHMVRDYLAEKIRATYRRNSMDIIKTCEELDTASVRKDILPHLHPRGVVTIIPAGSKPFRYERNDLAGEYPWGYASKKLGIEPVINVAPGAETAISGTSRPLSMAERKKKAAAIASGAVDTLRYAYSPTKTKTEDKEHELVSFRTIDGEKVGWIKPPKIGISEVKQFWNQHTSLSRPNKPELMYEGFRASTLKLSSGLVPWAKKEGIVIQAEVEQSAFRDKMQKAEEDKTKKAAATIDKDMSGLLTVDDKKAVVAMNKDISAGFFLTPAQMEVHLKNTPAYSMQVAIPFEQLITAGKKFWFRQEKRALVNWIMELATYILAKGLLDKKIEKAVADEDSLQREAPKKKSFAARRQEKAA